MSAGDEFVRAVMPALDLVHNLARRMVRDGGDAEDLVQETLTRAWAAWASGRLPRAVEPWLATICLNAGRDRLRRRGEFREVSWPVDTEIVAKVDVEGEAIARVQRGVLEAALWELSEEQRIAITLMDICGLTAAETAQVTGAPRGTVLARVHRGRKALARVVETQERKGRGVNRREP